MIALYYIGLLLLVIILSIIICEIVKIGQPVIIGSNENNEIDIGLLNKYYNLFINDNTKFKNKKVNKNSDEGKKILKNVLALIEKKYITRITSTPLYKRKKWFNDNMHIVAKNAYMSYKDKCSKDMMPVFIHIPKNAGTFITHKYVVKTTGHKLYSRGDIAVCRCPYDRIISVYNYIKMKKSFWHSDDGTTIMGEHPLYKYCNSHTLSEFVKDVCYTGKIYNTHTHPQWQFLENKNYNVPYLIRYENLQNDIDKLVSKNILRQSVFYKNNNSEKIKNTSEKSEIKLNQIDLFYIDSFYQYDFIKFKYNMKSKITNVGESKKIYDTIKTRSEIMNNINLNKINLSIAERIKKLPDDTKFSVIEFLKSKKNIKRYNTNLINKIINKAI